MYVPRGRNRGFGQADLSTWGYQSPCGAATSAGTPTTAAPGAACAPASSFPFFGTADNSGTCQPASMAAGLAAFGVGLLVLWGLFGTGGGR